MRKKMLYRLTTVAMLATCSMWTVVFAQQVTVVSPNGLQRWEQGGQKKILFSASGVANVRIEWSSNSGSSWSDVVASTPAASGSFDWSLPATLSDQCLVRISDVSNMSVSDVSDRIFALVAPKAGSEFDFVFFSDSPTPNFYDPSFGFVNAPSTLERVGDKCPVSPQYALAGNYALKLQWNSQSGGDWGVAIAGAGWVPRDTERKDSLVFNVLSTSFMFSSDLPAIYLEDANNRKTAKLPLRDFVGAIGQELWRRVGVPLQAFRDNPGQADLAQIKTVYFGQEGADGAEHTWFIDDIRMVGVRPFSDTVKVIAVLGSSSAAGVGPSTVDSAWVWRYRRYVQAFDSTARVVNLAVGGYTTYDVMPTGYVPPPGRPAPKPNNNISAALAYRPDAIIVALTSNDAAYGYSVDESLVNFDSIRNRSLSMGVPMWITSCAPRNIPEPDRLTALIVTKDSILNRYAPRAIDVWNGFAQPNGWLLPQYNSGDGIHQNDAGHAVIYSRVVAANIWQTITSIEPGWRIPQAIALEQNFPNPFNPATTIRYQLSESSKVSLRVFDVLGRAVATLVDEYQPAGTHAVVWHAQNASTGVYVYRLIAGTFSESKKMVLTK